ncbi:unnamed protein product [Angiostrongylus costaricensis]|uniref:Regulatory protein zeste n=1 Tax=Angiostrongylus costaricensis TaxID=334426 RepID=A0A0R3PRT3_ANGCS|nr:unnamed protein product [Angiostrongylus costaricensis]
MRDTVPETMLLAALSIDNTEELSAEIVLMDVVEEVAKPTVAEITERSFGVKEESTFIDNEHGKVNHRSNTKIIITGLDSDGDMTLARLRCLGIEMNNANLPFQEEEKPVSRMFSGSQKEKELRRERGEMLVRLFREHPRLADSATARKAEKNLERAQMWEKITCEVNDTFGSRLEILSVEKVKKLLSYYKKRDYDICDSIKTFGQTKACDDGKESEQLCTTPSSRCDLISSEHDVFPCEHPKRLEHGRETNDEIGELRRRLADRDAEIEHLRRRVVEQGDEYRSQINVVLDILKTAVDKVFENIRIFLGVA